MARGGPHRPGGSNRPPSGHGPRPQKPVQPPYPPEDKGDSNKKKD